MVQNITEQLGRKQQDMLVIRRQWAGSASDSLDGETHQDFAAAMAEAGRADTGGFAEKLEDLQAECDAHGRLLEGLHGWLAAPTSLLYDPALLRKVHQYMDKVLQLFLGVLKKNGCKVIHASYSKVLFATGKLRVIPDVQNFWEVLCENVRAQKALESLQLTHEKMSELFYGVLWQDPANWAGVPIDTASGSVVWQAKSCWKIADFLPPAVRPSMVLYACELLVGPQKELERRVISSVVVGGSCESNGGPKVTEDNADAEDGVPSDAEGMDVDAVPRGECEEEAPVAEN